MYTLKDVSNETKISLLSEITIFFIISSDCTVKLTSYMAFPCFLSMVMLQMAPYYPYVGLFIIT